MQLPCQAWTLVICSPAWQVQQRQRFGPCLTTGAVVLASAGPRGAVGSCRVPYPAVGSPAWLRVCRCVLECRAPLHLRTSCLGASRTAWKDEGAGESARREERSPWQKMYTTVLGKWLPALVCQLCFTEGTRAGWTGQSIWKPVNNAVPYCGTQIRLLCIYICKIHVSF